MHLALTGSSDTVSELCHGAPGEPQTSSVCTGRGTHTQEEPPRKQAGPICSSEHQTMLTVSEFPFPKLSSPHASHLAQIKAS